MRTLLVGLGRVACVLLLSSGVATLPASSQDRPQRDVTLLRCPDAPPGRSARASLGARSGSLETGSGHRLDVPARALQADREIELSELDGGSVGVRISAGASEMEFEAPVRLTLAYGRCPRAAEVESPVIVRVETDGTLSELSSEHDPESRTVSTTLSGNSEYALAVPRRPR